MRIIELIEDEENFFVISEVLKGGELFDRLISLKSFTEGQAAYLTMQIMEGLNYMHQQHITHRDLKPENILLCEEHPDCLDIRIADLGFARKFEPGERMDLALGTPLYMAPEMICHQLYDQRVDVWSLGCIVYQLLCGHTPFEAETQEEIAKNSCNKPLECLFYGKEWE